MTGNRSEKKVLMLAICCAAIILGVYRTFFNKEAEKTGDYRKAELSDTENESADELYPDGKDSIKIYFTNTKQLDEGNLPLEAQSVLVSEVQTFLYMSGYKDITELYLYDESYRETEEKISFICLMDNCREALQIEYIREENCLKYYILPDGTDAGGDK